MTEKENLMRLSKDDLTDLCTSVKTSLAAKTKEAERLRGLIFDAAEIIEKAGELPETAELFRKNAEVPNE